MGEVVVEWGGLIGYREPGGLDKAKLWGPAAVLTTRKVHEWRLWPHMGETLAMRMDKKQLLGRSAMVLSWQIQ